jgi:hypothetical protein
MAAGDGAIPRESDMTSPFRRGILALLLLTLTLLASSAAWAAGGPAGRNQQSAVAKPAPATLLGRAWSLLTALWDKEGCNIDPNGRCVTGPAPSPLVPAQVDTGCNIDPDGRCDS